MQLFVNGLAHFFKLLVVVGFELLKLFFGRLTVGFKLLFGRLAVSLELFFGREPYVLELLLGRFREGLESYLKRVKFFRLLLRKAALVFRQQIAHIFNGGLSLSAELLPQLAALLSHFLADGGEHLALDSADNLFGIRVIILFKNNSDQYDQQNDGGNA